MQHGQVAFPWGIGDLYKETCTRAGNYLVSVWPLLEAMSNEGGLYYDAARH